MTPPHLAPIAVDPPVEIPKLRKPHLAPIAVDPPVEKNKKILYLPVFPKFLIVMVFSFFWFFISVMLSYPWIVDLSEIFSEAGAWLIVGGIAFIPGTANAFLLGGLLFDRRPKFRLHKRLPPVSLLIAAYNEESCIYDTLVSVIRQKYLGEVQVIVIDDGSTDKTARMVQGFIRSNEAPGFSFRLIRQPKNLGKAMALNKGLKHVTHEAVVTIDADSYLYPDSLTHLVTNLVDSPPNTAAVAGTVLVRNSRKNFLTKIQEWDYFHGISVVKRTQSLFHGTLVAQGALSAYRKSAILDIGGWKESVGEDIVLTWQLHEKDYRIGYAENAFVFTNVPESYPQFFKQRKRWARGLLEAFRHAPQVVRKIKAYTPFVYLNLLFPYLDLIFFTFFIPGIFAAVLFQNYAICGVMTLTVLPVSIAINLVMFFKQRAIFRRYGLEVRQNFLGFVFYLLFYQLIMTPASLAGYFAELFKVKKSWGTK